MDGLRLIQKLVERNAMGFGLGLGQPALFARIIASLDIGQVVHCYRAGVLQRNHRIPSNCDLQLVAARSPGVEREALNVLRCDAKNQTGDGRVPDLDPLFSGILEAADENVGEVPGAGVSIGGHCCTPRGWRGGSRIERASPEEISSGVALGWRNRCAAMRCAATV
jgi:hypothetical protein